MMSQSRSPITGRPHLRPLLCREPSTDAVAVASDSDEAAQLFDGMRASIDALVGEPSKAEITAALRSLLEHGDVVSHHLPSSHWRSCEGIMQAASLANIQSSQMVVVPALGLHV